MPLYDVILCAKKFTASHKIEEGDIVDIVLSGRSYSANERKQFIIAPITMTDEQASFLYSALFENGKLVNDLTAEELITVKVDSSVIQA